jgi:hypothetical protein
MSDALLDESPSTWAQITPPRPEGALTRDESLQPVWLRLRGMLQDELTNAREELERPLDPVLTANLRGRIGMIKDLLALDYVQD